MNTECYHLVVHFVTIVSLHVNYSCFFYRMCPWSESWMSWMWIWCTSSSHYRYNFSTI